MFTVFYHPKAEQEANELPIAIRAKYDKLVKKLEQDPRLLREPDTKPLGNGLFELRTQGNDIARALWIYKKANRIIMLRIFIKKSQKISRAEIDLAWARLEEITL
ncbi:type II toxin-antitoxin system RelE/ParE family toxin [Rouxiella sp. T17]|uniref:type II toxin-antitoxin system RelE/ParE family toxin n=1 Tax=Rouxiella sp. T17 TaxID=3085684 RepID=UPI002FC5FA96